MADAVVDRLKKDFKDVQYRHVYDDGFLNSLIATQIKVLREERGWTQAILADKAGMNQSRISELEDVNFGSWTIRTLRRLAKAFDLRLKISFEEFGTLLHDFRDLNRRSLSRRSFDADMAFAAIAGTVEASASANKKAVNPFGNANLRGTASVVKVPAEVPKKLATASDRTYMMPPENTTSKDQDLLVPRGPAKATQLIPQQNEIPHLVKFTIDVKPSESYLYANVSSVSVSPFDIRINLADATPYGAESKTNTVMGLVMPPEHAAGLAILLCAQLANFEDQFGLIRHKQWQTWKAIFQEASKLTQADSSELKQP